MGAELIVAVLTSGVAAAIVSGATTVIIWILNNKKKKDDENTGIFNGVQVLLYDKIKYLGVKHIEAGGISAGDLEDLKRMHKIYHDELKGNGFLDDIMNHVEKLPIINKGA